ncbi:flap endonuclease 1-like isoform X1 [Pelodiscus sinensis]|uniref:flap endonuclease 1-like isoform X1 n=1 Tax=Pelodiscus sinensis TaxID=13735 RepID=UPI003F6BBAC0
MGISRLADVIKEEAAEAMSSFPLQQYRGRVIALDASIAIYQFRTAMPKIFNRNGENISHLQGLFYRTLHLLENGVLPVFVFDGRPPDLKQPLLARRAEAARARGDAAGSCLPASQQQPLRQDCETLLHYLGVPCVQAPAEAEATCAALVKSGRVWGTATEDMDALPFGSLRLIRHVNCKARGEVEEISLPAVLRKLGLTQEQFVDLCILLGCDYCGKIWRLGPKKALKLLQQHGTIEGVLQNIDLQKHPLPAHWDLEGARRLFLQPEVADPGLVRLEWRDPDVEGLVRFLAHEKHMNEVRVRRRLQKWREAQPAPGGAQPTPQAPGGAQPTPQAPGGAQPTPQAPGEAQPTPGGAQPTPQAPGGAQPTPQAPGGTQPTPQAPGEAQPTPQAPGGAQPTPQAPGGTQPTPQAPGGTQPTPQAPGGAQPTPQAPGEAQPTPQAPGEAQPTPQAPGGTQLTPQAPGGAQPTPQAPGGAQPTPQAPGEAQPTPQAPGGTQLTPQAPGGTQLTPQAPGGAQPTPGGAQPTPQAPGGTQLTPQAPGEAQPTPQAPGGAQPTPQAPGGAQPTPQAPGAGGRQWRLSDFFPASKQARALEAPGPRPSRKRQKRPVGSPEPGE